MNIEKVKIRKSEYWKMQSFLFDLLVNWQQENCKAIITQKKSHSFRAFKMESNVSRKKVSLPQKKEIERKGESFFIFLLRRQ